MNGLFGWLAVGGRALLLCFCLGAASGQTSFAKHGLFWGGSVPQLNAITVNGAWQEISGSQFNFTLTDKRTVVISYDATVQSLRGGQGNPLPREGSYDTLQMRAVVDGVPYRYTGGFASTYGVEVTSSTDISNIFAIPLAAAAHSVRLEWKKSGRQVEKWVLQPSALSIAAQADHEAVYPLQETRDAVLTVADAWKPLGSVLTITLPQAAMVTASYSLTVHPQLLAFIKDRAVEYVNTRLSLDGTAYTESGEAFGSNAWNPQSAALTGALRVRLDAGTHHFQLEWRKFGSAFKGWASQPSFLDGFASSRNLLVTMDKFDSPQLVDHTRQVISSDQGWTNVGDKMLNVFLTRESAVLIRYGLPVSQHENPNLDANTWQPLASLSARLLVDGIAYIYRGDTVSAGSRKIDDLFGQLALVLPAGTHSIALQWKSDGSAWTSLNTVAGGFFHGDQLLTFISSENAQPSFACPEELDGVEDEELIISSISVSDVDSALQPGMIVSVNLTTSTGTLSFPNQPFFSEDIVFIHSDASSQVLLVDTIANINAALAGMVYTAPAGWNGLDLMQIDMSDQGGTGYARALLTSRTVRVNIALVDDPFTLSTPEYVSAVVNTSSVVPISPIILADPDSDDDIFSVQLSATCGYLSVPEAGLEFPQGSSQAATMYFQGPYLTIKQALQSVSYLPHSACSNALHAEVVTITVANTFNLAQNITKLIILDIIRPAVSPAVFTPEFPRWKLRGLRLAGISPDITNFTATHYHSGDTQLFAADSLIESIGPVSPMSELVLLESQDMNYTLSVTHSTTHVRLLSPSYIIAGLENHKFVHIEPTPQGDVQVVCEIGKETFPAVIMPAGVFQCQVTLSINSVVDSTVWLRIVGTVDGAVLQTTSVAIHVISPPEVHDVQPSAVFVASQPTVRITTTSASIISHCLVGEELVHAFRVESNVLACTLPAISTNNISQLSFAVVTSDLSVGSAPIYLDVLQSITIAQAKFFQDEDSVLFVTMTGDWSADIAQTFADVSCTFNGGQLDLSFVGIDGEVFCALPISLSDMAACATQSNCKAALNAGGYSTPLVTVAGQAAASPEAPINVKFSLASTLLMPTQLIELHGPTTSNRLLNAMCDMDGLRTAALIVDQNTLICPSPVVQGTKELSLLDQMGEVLFSASLTVVQFPAVVQASPSLGAMTAAIDLSVTFDGALPDGAYSCMVNDEVIAAIVMAASSMTCRLPAGSAGHVPVQVLFNSAPVPGMVIPFEYTTQAILTAIQPKMGSLAGGTNVQVIGHGFSSYSGDSAITCMFGATPVAANVLNDGELSCVSPAMAVGIVDFTLRVPGRALASASLQFQFFESMVIKQLSTASVLTTGGESLLIEGYNFPLDCLCVFGQSKTTARYLNAGAIECTTPALSGDVAFHVELPDGTVSNSVAFKFIAPQIINSVSPLVAVRGASTAFALQGGPFHASDILTCSLDGIRGEAKYVTDSAMECSVLVTGAATTMTLLFAGVDSQWPISIVEGLGIAQVFPVTINTNTDQIVRIQGHGLQQLGSVDSDALFCKFGDALSAVVFMNVSDTIACISPAQTEPGALQLDILSDGASLALQPIIMRYIEPITVLDVYPSEGMMHGGERVVVRGVGFLPSLISSCSFGGVVVEGRWINATALECAAPAFGQAGDVSFTVMFASYSTSFEDMTYTYLVSSAVTSIAPQQVPFWSTPVLFVSGTGFSPLQLYQCAFQDITATAEYVDERSLRCAMPSLPLGVHTVKVFSTSAEVPSADLSLTVTSGVSMTELIPRTAAMSGGGRMMIKGSFASLHTSEVLCVFGTSTNTTATVLNDSTITCAIPAGASGRVPVSLATASCRLSAEPLFFHYVTAPLITVVHPAVFQATGGLAQVTGHGFSGSAVACRFGSHLMPAEYFNATLVTCRYSDLPIGLLPFDLVLDDAFVVSVKSMEVIPVVTVIGMSPSQGWSNGGVSVTLTVSTAVLTDSKVVQCVFGEQFTTATVISEEVVGCAAPVLVPGYYAVALDLDGLLIRSSSVYTVRALPVVQAVHPESIVHGAVLTVLGTNLLPLKIAACVFDNLEMDAIAVSSTELHCIAPSLIGDVAFGLIVDDMAVNTSVQLSFASSPLVYGASQDIVQTGASSLLLFGDHFDALQNVLCLFGDITTVGFVINATVVECTLPVGMPPGSSSIGIKLQNQTILGPGQVIFASACRLDSLQPIQGSTAGGVAVHVIGAGFRASDQISCKVGDVQVNGLFVDSSTVICSTPSAGEGQVAVKVAMNDLPCANSLRFEYKAFPAVSAIFPSIVVAGRNTSVQVSGTNFQTGASYHCVFGNQSQPAVVHSSSGLQCMTISSSSGAMEFFVSTDGGQSTSNRILIHFIDPIVIGGMSKQTVSTAGNDAVLVSGNAFPLAVAVDCLFDDLAIPGRVVNDSFVLCAIPSFSTASMRSFALSFGGYLLPVGPLAFVDMPMILSVLPMQLSSTDSTVLTVTVSAIASGELRCMIADQSFIGTVLDSNTIRCTATPSAGAGSMSFRLFAGDVEYANSSGPSILSVIAEPVVNKISPLSVVANAAVVFALYGDATDAEGIACHLGVLRVPALMTPDGLICNVAVGNVSAESVMPFAVFHGPVLVHQTNILVHPAITITGAAPLWAPVDSSVVVSMYGEPFVGELYCYYEDQQFLAQAVNSSVLQCVISTASIAGQHELTVHTAFGVLYRTTINVVPVPRIAATAAARDGLQMELADVTVEMLTLSWTCHVGILQYTATLGTLSAVCGIDEQTLATDGVVWLQGLDSFVSIATNAMPFSAVLPAVEASNIVPALLRTNETDMAQQSTLWANLNSKSSGVSESFQPTARDDSLITAGSHDMVMLTSNTEQNNNCSVGLKECIDWEADHTQISADIEEIAVIKVASGEASNATGLLVVDSVSPKVLNSLNDTWVTVQGRNFDHNTRCVVLNQTIASTVVHSDKTLTCLLPSFDTTRIAVLQLSVTDVLQDAISLNHADLVYDVVQESTLKPLQDPPYAEIQEEASFTPAADAQGQVCLSKQDCTNVMDALTIMSVPSVEQAHLFKNLYNNTLQGNSTKWNTTAYPLPIGKMEQDMAVEAGTLPSQSIFYMEPKSVTLPCDTCSVSYVAEGLLYGQSWCIKLQRFQMPCFVRAPMHTLACPLPAEMLPGQWNVTLLADCSDPVLTSTLDVLLSARKSGVTDQVAASYDADAIIWSDTKPVVLFLEPQFGFLAGNTPLRITLVAPVSAHIACRFSVAGTIIVQDAQWLTDTVLTCRTPSVAYAMATIVSLVVNSTSIIPTGFSFRYVEAAGVQSAAMTADANDTIVLAGQGFRNFPNLFCTLNFASGVPVMLIGSILSDGEALCGPIPADLHQRLVSCAVSFNGRDYLPAVPITSISSGLPVYGTTYGSVERITTSTSNVGAVVDSDPMNLQLSCDHVNYVPFSLVNLRADYDYRCVLNGVDTGSSILRTASQTVCRIDSTRPGNYVLALLSINALHSPLEATVHCIAEPKVTSVAIAPLTTGEQSKIIINGVNFQHGVGVRLRCMLDITVAVAGMDSNKMAECVFANLQPGLHVIKVLQSETVLFNQTICITTALLMSGGLLSPSVACAVVPQATASPPAQTISQMTMLTYQIRSATPHSGLIGGQGQVKVVADLINFRSNISCVFGDQQVDALVVDYDHVICRAPLAAPGNATLRLISTTDSVSWCCGWYFFYPSVAIKQVSPRVINGRDNSMMALSMFNLPSIGALYCFVNYGDVKVPALRLNSSYLLCALPPVHASQLAVSVGSIDEEWTNRVQVTVQQVVDKLTMIPVAGSTQGNTSVTIRYPAVLRFFSPTCAFGLERIQPVVIEEGRLVCVTNPQVHLGKVDVYILEGRDHDAPAFYVGEYAYAPPAEIVGVTPQFSPRGMAARVTISGAFFTDSEHLVCVFDEQQVPGRWLSEQLTHCDLPGELTIGKQSISVQVSNNGFDISTSAVEMQLTDSIEVISVEPAQGFTLGGTDIHVAFRHDIAMQLYCSFNGFKVLAVKTGFASVSCMSPKNEEGFKVVDIVDHAGNKFGSFAFTYITVPSLSITSDVAVLRKVNSTVSFTSTAALSSGLSGKLRTQHGQAVAGICKTVGAVFTCNDIFANNTADFLLLDITMNGHDHASAVAVVPVVTPTKLEWMDPLYTYASGNTELQFGVDHQYEGRPLWCVFESVPSDDLLASPRAVATMMAQWLELYSLRCRSPTLSLDDVNSLRIVEHGNTISGPSTIVVAEDPVVESLTASTLVVGVPQKAIVRFVGYVPLFPKLALKLGSDMFPLNMMDGLTGVAYIQANSVGPHRVQLVQVKNADTAIDIGSVEVLAYDQLVLDKDTIVRAAVSTLLITVPGCNVQNGTTCVLNKGSCSLSGLTACAMNVTVLVTADTPTVTMSICSESNCLRPLLTKPLTVLSSMTVITINPLYGPSGGNTLVTLYGSGFVNDATLMCMFGSHASPVVVFNSTVLQCATKKSAPQVVDVHIRRQGLVVSTSLAQYRFMSLMALMEISPAVIAWSGGTVLHIHTEAHSVELQYQCRFNEKFVTAVVINATDFMCEAPAFDVDQVNFAIAAQGSDLSVVQTLIVAKPLSALLIEPTVMAPMASTSVMVLFDQMLSTNAGVTCLVDGLSVMTTLLDDMLLCDVPALVAGEHILSVESYGVEVFSSAITARSKFEIYSVHPASSFASQSVAVTLAVNQDESGVEYSQCCFGEQKLPAMLLSASQWQCYSPIINDGGLRQRLDLEIGLARANGFCEYSGLQFSIIPSVEVTSMSPSTGSMVGGTALLLTTKHPLQSDSVYCSVASVVRLGLNTPEGIHCVTDSSAPGSFEVAVSTNGQNFLPTGQHFLFTYPVASNVTAEAALQTFAPPPLLFLLSGDAFPASMQYSVTVTGRNYAPDSLCALDQGTSMDTSFVSSTELICTLPVHRPGKDALFVINADGQRTKAWDISFTGSPALGSSGPVVTPTFGPRTSQTILTVHGQQFTALQDDLYCVIGDEWVFANSITNTSLKCTAPPNAFGGQVTVQVANSFGQLLPGMGFFEYIDDPVLFDVQPKSGVPGTEVVVVGKGFSKYTELSAIFGADPPCIIQSDTRLICTVPESAAGDYHVYLVTSDQHTVGSGMIFSVVAGAQLDYLWPLNGPAIRGGTVLSIYGSNFPSTVDVTCMIDGLLIAAYSRSESLVQCRLPPHKPGVVKVALLADGIPLSSRNLDFVYVPDVSVDKITPEFGYTAGEFPVIVFGSNFVNTTSLGCMFADMKSRGIFLSPNALLCLSPSPLGRSELVNRAEVPVEVTMNGLDYSESNVTFAYSQPCDKGFYCPGMTRQLCPNGTYCPENSRNFTLCEPGTFQPMQGQVSCVICPVGYICPDLGMPRPIICPAGLVCDIMGLRASTKLCPAGRYCLNGTKSIDIDEFEASNGWVEDYVSGVVYFNSSKFNYDFNSWPAPAVGESRPQAPPEASCDGLVCAGGSSNVLAEAPFPCPIGHYCRAGAVTQIPMPKNFSSPQRCYDGFFCPRGSVAPEGSGPCPNGYFCPTQMDAIICPAGHYCPGVGNTNPVECYPGTYNPFEGRANCTVCPTGHICPGWGLFLPELCPSGFVCMSLGLSYPVVLCPQGYYCKEGTLTLDPSDTTSKKPFVCAEGQFCLGGVNSKINVEWIPSQPYGSSHPQLCSEGTYCESGAYLTSGSGLCFKGHYCPPNSSFPIETPVGNFASGLGSVAPTLCYPGTYAPLEAQVDCLKCPAGHTCISYGTYTPTICGAGTYRSLIDSVTCTQCPTGTYSNFVGAPDISLCLPCPKGRICGVKQMIDLASSVPCPAGYICGYGSDRSSQFEHLAPAGFHTTTDSTPYVQFDSVCTPGFYCQRGTPTYLQNGGKCTVGSYCPQSTPAAISADVKCPMYTTSLSGLDTLQGCRIDDINVCDKTLVDTTRPMEDITYYSTFSYTLLDDTGTVMPFDSSAAATRPTGEVRTVAKVHPLNESASTPMWQNDTIEAFRACPLYGSGAGNDIITIIGRNFMDNGLNYCKFTACSNANLGKNPRRCKNQVKQPNGADLPKTGNLSDANYITKAKYLSSTRMECTTPRFLLDQETFPTFAENGYECAYLDYLGLPATSNITGNYSFVRPCYDPNDCVDKPQKGYEFFNSLTFPCSVQDISIDGTCTNQPELNYMFNPCMSAEVVVEVTNDGEHYSGGDTLQGTSYTSTVRYGDGGTIYNSFKNYSRNATFAVFTYVHPAYFYDNPSIMVMEREYCALPRYSEEEPREREQGWFLLKLQEVAHVQVDLSFLPDNMVYGEHYSIAIFVQPSRCKVELCNSVRVRLSPEEFLPCRKPLDFSYWFSQTDVPKNVVNNITIYALDDVLFKVEIHLLYGLHTANAPLFQNTTTILVEGPGRSKSFEGQDMTDTKIRKLSPFVSFTEKTVVMQYFFCAVVYREDSNVVSQPLNLPPLYDDYQRGRVLVMNNVSADNPRIPLKIDPLSQTNKGVEFWLMPATTPAQSKELLDAYFETFHDTTYDSVNGYQFDFTILLLGYLPYFSNCYTFDSYIPLWMLVESAACQLPDTYPEIWPRYKFPPLPDQDDIRFVGPFDFFEDPVADWCERDIQCNYEEDLTGQDNTPRWFELGTDDSLFQIIRLPLTYYDYTGRAATTVSASDAGGGNVVNTLAAISGDNFIDVTVDHSLGDLIPGCILQCFAREYTLTIAYYQENLFNKRIIYATLAGDAYDTDQTKTNYNLHVSFFALSFMDLILNFAFPLSIFIVIFCFVGFLVIFFAFLGWAVTRATTLLQNPPQLKFMSMVALIVPPPLAGVTMAVVAIWAMTSMGNYFINGYLYTDPNSPTVAPLGDLYLDVYPLQYGSLGAIVGAQEMQQARYGRMGSVFFIVGFCCFMIASKMYFPRDESKREREIAKRRTDLAKKRELWDPVMWKKANFMFTSFVLATILTLVVELSFWTDFGTYFYQVLVMLIMLAELVTYLATRQLNDAILVAPLLCGYGFVIQLIGFGSPDFLAFLSQNFMGFMVASFQRVFQSVWLNMIFSAFQKTFNLIYGYVKAFLPRYLTGGAAKPLTKEEEEAAAKDYRKRAVEGVQEAEEESESVEPILGYFSGVSADAMVNVYFPFFVYLFMQYRDAIQIPIVYGIRQSDMMIYLVYQLFYVGFQPIVDIFNHSQCELYHGWKIYEYLVYSRYRFLQRETRWKGMENNLDECIEESLRRLDQMCFSSQYFLMLTFQVNGIIYITLAYEVWLFWDYSPFSDSAFFIVLGFMVSIYLLFRWVVFWLAVKLRVYRIKHENTAWHLIAKDEDELDVPAWEEIKGASTEAFLMNQRITSETFRYKFLNYNRTWLINQLPQLLTPRTLRRSRPYLINQLARIINARRDDISDDESGEEENKKFGPVALTSSSREIIRYWLGKARRRVRLRLIVEPLIKNARGVQCEQCLSRKQLQIEYEVDIDQMAGMYDKSYPDDEEVDQGQWKTFWINNQRYHTICLACLTKRKELEARAKIKGGMLDASMFEDDNQEAYPDWGPVFLTAASKAMLLNWYRRAQKLRAAKRRQPRNKAGMPKLATIKEQDSSSNLGGMSLKSRKERTLKDISDDEGDDPMFSWLREGMKEITPASKAIAIKWMRTARARLQQKRGKGQGAREGDAQLEELEQGGGATGDTFKSGRKSKMAKK